MKCKATRNIDVFAGCEPYVKDDDRGRKIIPSGTIICQEEYPPANCVSLVLNGLAEPADEECRAACNLTAAQIAEKKTAMDRLLSGKGLAEEDEEDEEEDD